MGLLPRTSRQRTWSGGLQILVAHALGVRNWLHVVAPSSVEEDHQAGAYAWDVPPLTVPLALMPGWLRDMILRAQGPTTSEPPSYDRGRNDALFTMARGLHWRGRSEAEVRDTIRIENLENCHPPLPEHAVSRIFRSVLSYPAD
jgi:hypothetical protein